MEESVFDKTASDVSLASSPPTLRSVLKKSNDSAIVSYPTTTTSSRGSRTRYDASIGIEIGVEADDSTIEADHQTPYIREAGESLIEYPDQHFGRSRLLATSSEKPSGVTEPYSSDASTSEVNVSFEDILPLVGSNTSVHTAVLDESNGMFMLGYT